MGKASPLLRFGVASDPHVTDWASAAAFRKALRWYRDQGVDAVMVAGDLTDHGLLPQLENVARSWREVFPDDRTPDGRHVEKLFIYGNHDFEGLAYRDRWMDAAFAVHDLSREEAEGLQLTKVGMGKAWAQCFGEPYSPIWRKRVRGYDFIGGHSAWKAPAGLGEWFAANAGSIDSDKPFFYFQHPHPRGTVYGPRACGCDEGASSRLLSSFPNAVAFSGHSHLPLTDECGVWRGSFTSVGTSSLSYACFSGPRENARVASWTGTPQMPSLGDIARAAAIGEEGGEPIRQGMLADVFDDHIALRRLDFVRDEELDEPWVLPLPARGESFAARAERTVAPEFQGGAAVSVSFARGRDRAGEETDQVTASVPPAVANATRPFDYEVSLEAREGDVSLVIGSWRFYSPTVAHPKRFDRNGNPAFILARSILPGKAFFRFSVRPFSSYGVAGKPLFSSWLNQQP